ncbi:MAG: TonB-dependent receptor, partial [Bacteroidia bacterium]
YKIIKDLEFSVSGSYTNNNTLQEQWWGENSHYIARLKNGEYESIPRPGTTGYSELPYGGLLKTNNSKQESYTARAQVDYRKLTGSKNQHMYTAMGGFELNGSNTNSLSDENRGFVKNRGMQFIDQIDLESFPYYKTWLNKNHRVIRFDKNRQVSAYTTLGYSFYNYITLNANARVDASNKFGSRSNEKMLPVWSVSSMVNIGEIFMSKNDWVNDWRLRSSFGKQGNMLEDQSPNLIIKQGVIDPFYNENISNIARFPNPNLLWEQTKQFNISMDWALFNNRVNLSANYYSKNTKDAFTTVQVSSINGVPGNSYVMNGGDLENKGYSISLSGVPIRTKNFSWRASTYFGGNYNKVKTNKVETYSIDDYLNGTALVGNQPVSTFYSYKFLGLNPINGSPIFDDYNDRRHLLEGKSLEEVLMMVTVNSGQREPIFTGALSNTLNYKSFSLMMNFTYSLGSKMRLFSMYDPIIRGVSAENNIRKEFLNRWMVSGDENYTNIPAIMSPSHPEYFNYNPHFSNIPSSASKIPMFASNVWSMYDRSDLRVVSGDYLKLSTLTFRYSFDKKLIEKMPFSNAYLSFNTINLFTLTSKELKGQDPTQAGFAKPNLSIRPTYTLQFSVTF